MELRDRHKIRSALWVGGEPLLRPQLLTRAIALFARNAVVSSGAAPFVPLRGAGLLVSFDGLAPTHDSLRGAGSFAKTLAHVAALEPRSFGLMVTVTAQTMEAVAQLPALVAQTRASGALVGCYVGGDAALRLDPAGRDELVNRLEQLRVKAPGVLLGSSRAIALMRPRHQTQWMQGCIYRRGALAFDARLEPRHPCTYGAASACEACGCPVVALQLAMAGGDVASRTLLRELFVGAA